MTTTQTPGPFTALLTTGTRGVTLVLRNGETIGRVEHIATTYRAIRRTGEIGVDARRVAQGFRTASSAASWVARV